MAKVITFSRKFPAYHPRKGQPTFFVEKFINSIYDLGRDFSFHNVHDMIRTLNPRLSESQVDAFRCSCNPDIEGIKRHTIRIGFRFKPGELFSPRVWGDDINPKTNRSGPYHSKQIIIGPQMKVERTYKFEIMPYNRLLINGKGHCSVSNPKKASIALEAFAINDGLNAEDLLNWFKYPKPVIDHQIICWDSNVKY